MKIHDKEHLFSVEVTSEPPETAEALLIPIPPATHFQRARGYSINVPADGYLLAQDCELRQEAAIIPISRLPNEPVNIQYRVALGDFSPEPKHFCQNDNKYLTVSDDVLDRNAEIFEGASGCLPQQELTLIAGYLADTFSYVHHDDTNNRTIINCNHLEGDCLDINTAFMKLLRLNGFDSAYYIGLYFEETRAPYVEDDWHCWVSTKLNAVADWDIAHHIKYRLRPVEPNLNPGVGTRFALSTGRGLRFHHGSSSWMLSHIGAPMWLLRGGKSRQARFCGTFESRREKMVC